MGIHTEIRRHLIKLDQRERERKSGRRAFHTGSAINHPGLKYDPNSPVVVISDWMGRFYQAPPGQTTALEVFQNCVADIHRAFNEGVHTYVILADQSAYVPREKEPTQEKRRKYVKPRRGYDQARPPAPLPFGTEEEKEEKDDEDDDDDEAATDQVEPYVDALDAYFVDDGLVRPSSVYGYQPQPFDLQRMQATKGLSAALWTYFLKRLPTIPIRQNACVIFDWDMNGVFVREGAEWRMISELRHRMGEADLAMLYWFQRFRDCHILVETRDTDTIPIVLGYLGACTHPKCILWEYDHKHYCHLQALYSLLFDELEWSYRDLLVMVLCCGTDYVEKKLLSHRVGFKDVLYAVVSLSLKVPGGSDLLDEVIQGHHPESDTLFGTILLDKGNMLTPLQAEQFVSVATLKKLVAKNRIVVKRTPDATELAQGLKQLRFNVAYWTEWQKLFPARDVSLTANAARAALENAPAPAPAPSAMDKLLRDDLVQCIYESKTPLTLHQTRFLLWMAGAHVLLPCANCSVHQDCPEAGLLAKAKARLNQEDVDWVLGYALLLPKKQMQQQQKVDWVRLSQETTELLARCALGKTPLALWELKALMLFAGTHALTTCEFCSVDQYCLDAHVYTKSKQYVNAEHVQWILRFAVTHPDQETWPDEIPTRIELNGVASVYPHKLDFQTLPPAPPMHPPYVQEPKCVCGHAGQPEFQHHVRCPVAKDLRALAEKIAHFSMNQQPIGFIN